MAYHHGNLEESLLQAGQEELGLHGVEKLSLREIAKKAGVSHNAPYRHFRDKYDFVERLLERSLFELSEQILAAPLLYPISVFMQAQYMGRLWAQLALKHPRKAHLLCAGLTERHDRDGEGHGETSRSHDRRLQATHLLVRQNISSVLRGALGRELRHDADVDKIAILLIASFRGLTVLYTSQAESALLGAEENLFDLFDLAAENILRSEAL